MIGKKRILGIIPVRGGSKGVPRKNIRIVAGKPLFIWSVLEANKSNYLDRIIVSTDDEEIIDIAHQYGCDVPFKRPIELATDEISTIEVVLHAIDVIDEKYDYVVLLQATSPLRTVADIDKCISMCIEKNVSSVVSMTKVEKSPYWMYSINEKNGITPLLNSSNRPTRRQDADDLYQLNGAIYVNEIKQLVRDKSFVIDTSLAYVMSAESSIDIDTELDLIVLEQLMMKLPVKPLKEEP